PGTPKVCPGLGKDFNLCGSIGQHLLLIYRNYQQPTSGIFADSQVKRSGSSGDRRSSGKDMSKVARGVPQLNSDIARARNPLTMGKLFGVRETTAPPMTLALPSVFRMKSRFTTSLSAGNSVHFASKSSNRPPTSTTKSTSRVRSRQKNKLPARPARRSRLRNWAKTNVSQIAPTAGDW